MHAIVDDSFPLDTTDGHLNSIVGENIWLFDERSEKERQGDNDKTEEMMK